MKPIFLSRLVNSPFDDPSVYVRVVWGKRAFFFDLGTNTGLPTAKLLKITDVFISHTHVDHFIGFDHLLRVHIGRKKTLRLFGPPGLIGNVKGKLAGYTWNLVKNNKFIIEVSELQENAMVTAVLPCALGFREQERRETAFEGTVIDEPLFRVRAEALDHMIPSLAYALEEKMHINIRKERLDEGGYAAGPWLQTLKEAIREGRPDDHPCRIVLKKAGGARAVTRPLGELREALVLVSRGQKIAYVADAVYSDENRKKIVSLARDADLFYCEATFSQNDTDKGLEKYHLTAAQAGRLAREAGVDTLVIFHFSPKYATEPWLLYHEAAEVFPGTQMPSK
jgi:ribonuclease Z